MRKNGSLSVTGRINDDCPVEPASTEEAVRVVIASERSIMAEGIRHALSVPTIEVAAVCVDRTATLHSISVHAPNVLVADVSATGLTNTIISRVCEMNLQTRTVVILDRIDNSELSRAARLGVFGVVSIKAAPEELRACVLAVASGVIWIQSGFTHSTSGATEAGPIAATANLDSLTVQQRKIAELVAVGMRNKRIATELAITEGTVKVHLHTIFTRLGITSRIELGNALKFPWFVDRLGGSASAEK